MKLEYQGTHWKRVTKYTAFLHFLHDGRVLITPSKTAYPYKVIHIFTNRDFLETVNLFRAKYCTIQNGKRVRYFIPAKEVIK